MKFVNTEFELLVADMYQRKVASAASRNIEFRLSLVSMRNLLRTLKCPYTGELLTIQRGDGKPLRPTDGVIDRICNKKGYVPGNVMAISHVANQFKALFENPNYSVSMGTAERMLNLMQRRIAKVRADEVQK